MEIKDIILNQAFSAAVDFQDGASGHTVTYTIKKLSDGSVFASGNATWVVDGVWKVSFTPTVDAETYVLTVTNSTLGVSRSLAFRATQSPAAVTAEVSGSTPAELLTAVNAAILKLLNGGGVAMYTVNGRTVQYMSLQQLYDIRKSLQREVNGASSAKPQNTNIEFEDF